MNTPISKLSGAVLLALIMSAAPGTVMHAVAQPSQKPLLSNQSGAKPNLMIALDNSGSMAYPFDEAYELLYNDNVSRTLRRCPSPNRNSDYINGAEIGGRVMATLVSGGITYTCINNANTSWIQGADVAYVPARTASNNMLAQRSADVNPVYYNPRTTYSPRLGPDYLPLARPATPTFVSNAASSTITDAFYQVYRDPISGALYTVNQQKPAPAPRPAWATPVDNAASTTGNRVYGLRAYAFPVHAEITTAGTNLTPPFTYTFCRDAVGASTVQTTPEGKNIGCSSVRRTPFNTSAAGSFVSVFAPGHPSAAGNVIQLPSDHTRTDCAAGNSCTNAEEINNILNWYHWYSTRQLATSTAIGQSLASNDFQGNLRIGYMPINDYTLPNGTAGGNTNLSITKTPGVVTNETTLLRGVRMLQGNTTASTELFSFLNGIQSRGGTPLHNAISQIANYYSVPGAAQENPWSSNPAAQASASNPEMSCRRSFNLLFSDGGWTTSIAPPVGPDYDNTNGPTFSRVLPDGTTENFQYLRTGESTLAGRIKYAPFPSTGTGGLADLTAQFFWHTDLRPALTNGILTRPGQPAFWQNMTTYTVGYLIRPTAEVTGGAGLTFGRIDQYRAEFIADGYAAATKPTWPTGNLVTTSTNQVRVDDFIHAGYTGGGRSFNARSAGDVRRIFDTILSEILGASGNDAGVSTGTSGTDNSTLAGRLKYGVTYRTLDNSGEVTAYELDANGDVVGTEWTASTLVPNHTDRRVFTMSGTNTPTDFSGNFSALPADVRNTLKQGPDAARIANNATFVNYLRGMDPARDPSDKLFRQRASKIASIVNAAPLFMGGDYDFGYDLDKGNVEGKDYYLDFTNRKRGYPGSLFVATNAGMVHSLDAETGVEQAVMMPRRSLSRMLHFADEAYDFEYVLDGSITQHDVFDNRLLTAGMKETDKWQAWRHLAMGAGGRGEKLIYAINSPFKSGTTPSRIPDRQDFLWETGPDLVDAADGSDVKMGYVSNTFWSGQNEIIGSATDPAIVGSDSDPSLGRWIVAVNNGHYNGNTDGSQAGLIVLDAKTGEVLRTIPLPGLYPAGRGLSGVTLVREYEGHKRVVAAYAGDANGQLWRFNLIGNPSQWHVSYGRPLFTVPGNRPIYGAPAWRNHPQGGLMVVFATGMALEESDIADQGAQSIYAIWDPTTYAGELLSRFDPFTPVAEGDLLSQSVLPATATVKDGITYYSITDNKIDWKIHRGWRLPMGSVHSGERSIADAINVSSSVLISSTVLQTPADPNLEMCTASAQPLNCVYVLNGLEASARTSRSFDVIGDGKLDNYSVACIPEGGFSRGVSVITRFTKTDGTPLPDETPPPPIGPPEDPQKPRDVPGPGAEPPPGSRPPGEGGGPCDEQRIDILGTGNNSLDGGITCPGSGWSRSQYQLSAPPAK